MKWLLGVFLAVAMLAAVPAQAHHRYTPPVEILSQNLYLGADLSRVLQGEPPSAVLETILQTNYPDRAVKIAEAIDDFNPDVIGLQEVWTLTVFDSKGNVSLNLNYLDILLTALKAEGESYAVASISPNADVTLPIDPVAGVFGRVQDSDVILYRTSTTSVSNAEEASFSDNFTVELGGFPIEFTRGYQAVDANVHGHEFRFVNTHFEVADAPCVTEKGLVECQDLQADELMRALAYEHLPVVLVGDFNADPHATAYDTIVHAGYLDTWPIGYNYANDSGNTCCQAETLDNEKSLLFERIDHIFISKDGLQSVFGLVSVVGDWEERKTDDGLWYSDHGGPWARLYLKYN